MPIFTHRPDIPGTLKINLRVISFKFTSLEMMTDELGYQKKCIYGGRSIDIIWRKKNSSTVAIYL